MQSPQPQGRSAIAAVRRGWCHPRPVRSFAEKLLAQQLWCWGCDIRRDDGNLLLQHGFSRHRPDDEQGGSSCYRLDENRRHINLWGFGIFYGERRSGGLYLGRAGFSPSWSAVESLADGVHWADDLPGFSRPRGAAQWQRSHLLCRRMLQWIASYERWVIGEVGIDYRRQCVNTWMRPLVKADQMPRAWAQLSRRCWDRGADDWRRITGQLVIQSKRPESSQS
jgi:hypothetical protein